MKTPDKNTIKSNLPVWQLPVKERLVEGKPDYVHPLARVHCFVGGESLCKKYYQDTDFFETDVDIGTISKHPEHACQICLRRWRKIKGDSEE